MKWKARPTGSHEVESAGVLTRTNYFHTQRLTMVFRCQRYFIPATTQRIIGRDVLGEFWSHGNPQ